ncbi:MAG TPA: biotin-dependent carboxyltransferase family protein, partial [Ilumatobacteraceae bacterium]
MLEIVRPGPLCTVQDGGRHGWAHLGVGHSGAADQVAFALANRLVGNAPGAAVLEATFGGVAFRAQRAVLIAVAGAPCDITVVGGPSVGHQQPVALPVGAEVHLSVPRTGLRTYVAVRGGVDVHPVLGSRSTDLLSGLGPSALSAGELLAVGPDPGTPVPTEAAPWRPWPEGPIALWPGPRL